MESIAAEDLSRTAGGSWVDRFLTPLLQARLNPVRGTLDCVQIWGEDDDEAARLRSKGHTCVVLMPDSEPLPACRWHQTPVVANLRERLPLADHSVDFVFTGAIGRLTHGAMARIAFARELGRVVRPGGAILVSVGNRYCPVDLQDRKAFLHGPHHPARTGLHEMESAFEVAGLPVVQRLGVKGHFRWGRVPRPLQGLASLFNAYLEWASDPGRRWVYASPLNPVLMLWIAK